MEQTLYKVVYRGRIASERSVSDVKQALAALMQAQVDQIETLFSGQAVVIKKDLSSDVALRYIDAFSSVGAIAEMKPQDEVEARADPVIATASTQSFEFGADHLQAQGVESFGAAGYSERRARATGSAAVATPPVPYTSAAPEYRAAQVDDGNPILYGIGFLIKLVFTLAITGIAAAALLLVVLRFTTGLEMFGFGSIKEVLAYAQSLVQNFMQ